MNSRESHFKVTQKAFRRKRKWRRINLVLSSTTQFNKQRWTLNPSMNRFAWKWTENRIAKRHKNHPSCSYVKSNSFPIYNRFCWWKFNPRGKFSSTSSDDSYRCRGQATLWWKQFSAFCGNLFEYNFRSPWAWKRRLNHLLDIYVEFKFYRIVHLLDLSDFQTNGRKSRNVIFWRSRSENSWSIREMIKLEF